MDDVCQLGAQSAQPVDQLGVRLAPAQGGQRCDELVVGPVVAAQQLERCLAGLAMGDGVGQHGFLRRQPAIFLIVVDPGGVEFADLESQQVDLAGARLLVAAQHRQLGIEFGQPGASFVQRGQVDRTELVERGALRGGRQQSLMSMLAVQVDHLAGQVGQRADGCRATVDVCPRSSDCRNHPRQHDLLGSVRGLDFDPAIDPSLVRPGPHDRGVGASTHQQVDRLDQHRLAGTRFAGERSDATVQHERRPFDHTQVLDVQFGQHDAVLPVGCLIDR